MNVQFNGYLNIYADDTSITVAPKSVEKLITLLNKDMESFLDWSIRSKLTINVGKTKLLPYFLKRKNNFLIGHNLWLNGRKIEIVKTYTYLGVRLDSNITMEAHVKHLFNTGVNMVFS